jgi:hypothetical protein
MSETLKEIFQDVSDLKKRLTLPQDMKLPEFKEKIECTKQELLKLKNDIE